MSVYAVSHPEVDETLYVAECVVRVGCPHCKVEAGVPCQGARLESLALGTRRGFRYTQETHFARRSLFSKWKERGRPDPLPPDLVAVFEAGYGPFSSRIDTLASPLSTRQRRGRGRRKASPRQPAPPVHEGPHVIDHHGIRWEAYGGRKLWSFYPPLSRRDLPVFSVYDHTDLPHRKAAPFCLSGESSNSWHATLDDAFDHVRLLIVRARILGLLQRRAQWRVTQLERLFGAQLSGAESASSLLEGVP